MLIYMITNTVNGKRYIGQTRRTLAERKSGHHQAMLSGVDTHLYRAMRKYGFDNFEWKELDTSANSIEELNKLETKYIELFDTVNTGYNMYYGGDSNAMDEKWIREKHDKKMRAEETRKKISASLKKYREENPFSDNHRQNISKSLKKFYADGKKPKYKKPQHLSEEHKQKLIESRHKKVKCTKEDFCVEFDSLKDASDWLNKVTGKKNSYKHNASRISKSAKNKIQFNGYFWEYNSCVETIEKQ